MHSLLKFLVDRKLDHYLKMGSLTNILFEDIVFHANFLKLLQNGRISNRKGDGVIKHQKLEEWTILNSNEWSIFSK